MWQTQWIYIPLFCQHSWRILRKFGQLRANSANVVCFRIFWTYTPVYCTPVYSVPTETHVCRSCAFRAVVYVLQRTSFMMGQSGLTGVFWKIQKLQEIHEFPIFRTLLKFTENLPKPQKLRKTYRNNTSSGNFQVFFVIFDSFL